MSTPSPETHVFVGMFRPPFADVLQSAMKDYPWGWPEGQTCWDWHGSRGIEKCREAWLLGRFDTCVYKTIEEVVRMRRDEPVLLPERT